MTCGRMLVWGLGVAVAATGWSPSAADAADPAPLPPRKGVLVPHAPPVPVGGRGDKPPPEPPPRPPVQPPDAETRAQETGSYIWPDDIRLSGRHLAAWTSPAGEQVMLFKGNFKFEVYKFRAEGRDGVVWLRPARIGGRAVHLVTAYFEGNVHVTGTEDSRTRSDRFLISHATTGKVIRSADTTSDVTAQDDGVYVRGLSARQAAPAPKQAAAVAAAGAAAGGDPKALGGVDAKDPRNARDPKDPPAAAAPGDPSAAPPPPTAPVKRVVFGRADFELRTVGDQIQMIVTGYRPTRPDGKAGPVEPVRISYTDMEMIADSMVLFTNRRLLEATGSRSGTRPDVFEGVYLEGDVQINSKQYTMRASRLYFDFGTRAGKKDQGPSGERAIVLDGVIRAYDEGKGVPLWLRGSEIQLLARDDFVAENAIFTTDDFNPPHFHIGAKRLHMWDVANRVVQGTGQTRLDGNFEAEKATVNIRNQPVFVLPFIGGEGDPRPDSLKTFKFGHSSQLGYFGTTQWFLWKVLGMEPPIDGVNAYLDVDIYSARGPSFGAKFDWDYPRSSGQFGFTYLHDDGTDKINNVQGDIEPTTQNRGRILFRNKKFFDESPEFGISKGWEATVEMSYISDPNYLAEFGRFELLEEKEQETLLYIKKKGLLDRENWAFHATLQPRILNFLTQVQRLPEFAVVGVGEPIADGLGSWYSDNRAGLIQLSVAGFQPSIDPTTGEEIEPTQKQLKSELDYRADSRQELEVPFQLGPLNFTGYATGRVTGYGDTPRDGSVARVLGTAGLRGLTSVHRTYDNVDSRLFDVHRLRHIITAEVNAWGASTNYQPYHLFVYDYDVDAVGAQSGVQAALRQVLQTKRGGPDRQTTVDWMTFDAEIGFFTNNIHGFLDGNNQLVNPITGDSYPFNDEVNGTGGFYRGQNVWYRPEDSIPRNHAAFRYGWRVTEGIQLLADAHMDLDHRPVPVVPRLQDVTTTDADGNIVTQPGTVFVPQRTGNYLDQYGVGVVLDRSPRYKVFFGYRHVDQLDADVLTGNVAYKLNEKYSVSFGTQYELNSNKFVRTQLVLTRRLPRFLLSVGLSYDNTRDNVGFSFNLEPEGFSSPLR